MAAQIKSPVRPELVEGLAVPIDCYRFNPIMVRQAHHERIKSALPYVYVRHNPGEGFIRTGNSCLCAAISPALATSGARRVAFSPYAG